MTGFVNRINTADQSIDRNKKLPVYQNESIGCSGDAVFARWRRRAKPVKGGIERSVNWIIVGSVVVYSRSNSEILNISIQNLFKVSKREGFQNGTLSEI